MKSAGKARNNGLYRHIRTSKEIIRNLLNDYTEIKTSENHRQNRWFTAGEKGAQNEPPEEPPKPSLSTEEPPELLLSSWGGS